jgi:hypothetical protein
MPSIMSVVRSRYRPRLRIACDEIFPAFTFHLPPECPRARLIGNDQSISQRDFARAIRRHRIVVRHQQDGAALGVQVGQQSHDLATSIQIEIAGRFVSQNERRVVDQRAGNRDALLLTSRQLGSEMACARC